MLLFFNHSGELSAEQDSLVFLQTHAVYAMKKSGVALSLALRRRFTKGMFEDKTENVRRKKITKRKKKTNNGVRLFD